MIGKMTIKNILKEANKIDDTTYLDIQEVINYECPDIIGLKNDEECGNEPRNCKDCWKRVIEGDKNVK